MRQVFYIHGGAAYSEYEHYLEHLRNAKVERQLREKPRRWADSLAADLGADYEVIAPVMPNKYNARYEEWKIWFERFLPFLEDGVVLVGWSQGGMFLVRFFSENTLPVSAKALFLIAVPLERISYQGDDGGDFYANSDKIPALAERIGQITVIHSEDDFVVPYHEGEKLTAIIPGAELVTFTDKNHFLIEEFPELLERIRALS